MMVKPIFREACENLMPSNTQLGVFWWTWHINLPSLYKLHMKWNFLSMCWLRRGALGSSLSSTVHHDRSKHIDRNFHFIRGCAGDARTRLMPSLLEQLSSLLAWGKNRAVDWTRTDAHSNMRTRSFFIIADLYLFRMHSNEFKGHSYAQKLPRIAC